jgi:hypothetical protein
MAITDKQVDEMCRKLAISFGVATTDDLVKEMVNRFLNWKLPANFNPDAGISFKPEYNVEYMAKQGKPPMRHEPIGTNLFHAGQAEEMVRHMLGLPNVQIEGQREIDVAVDGRDYDRLSLYLNECKALVEKNAALEDLLKDIGDFAHDRSTGPAVPDDLWEVRRLAYEGFTS